MRNWGDILDASDLNTCALETTNGGFTTRTWSLYLDIDLANTMLHRPFGGSFSCQLCGEWGRLARTRVPNIAGGGPGQNMTFLVGDADDGVVEARFDVSDTMSDVLA